MKILGFKLFYILKVKLSAAVAINSSLSPRLLPMVYNEQIPFVNGIRNQRIYRHQYLTSNATNARSRMKKKNKNTNN